MSEPNRHIDPALLVGLEENQLEDSLRAEVMGHVDGCGVCQAELALVRQYRAIEAGAKLGARSERLTQSFGERLDHALASTAGPEVGRAKTSLRSPAPRPRTPWLGRGLLVASVAVLAFGVFQMRGDITPGDLGETMRSDPTADRIALEIVTLEPEGWEIRWQLDTALRDPVLRVTTSGGQLALERDCTTDPERIVLEDLGEHATAEILFVQLIAVDALGGELRSQPLRLR